jgi:two-component system LytT family sensor kinase
MKIQTSQISKHLPFLALGILCWLGFSYLYVLFLKMNLARSIHNFPWHSDAPIWTFRECLMGAAITIFVKWKFDLLTEISKSLLRDFLILALLIPVNSFLITAFHTLVLGATYSGGERAADFNWVMGTISGLIIQTFVSFTCVGYFYMTLVNQTKEKLIYAQKAKSEMELKTLQQNIEPHFLFNNLNVLSSLIESNPNKANDFLSRLAELYRYILQTQTLEVVPVKDELTFAENYIYLLRERFGDAYNFAWEVPENKLNGQMIVPVALQALIENAVKHNAGSNEKPLPILIKLEEDSVSVKNEIRAKQLTFQSNQSGLQNLQTRYAFLTDKPVEISQAADFFTVKLPLIRNK